MPPTPLEQLAGLNVHKAKDAKENDKIVVADAESAARVAKSDLAYQRICSSIKPVLTLKHSEFEHASVSQDDFQKFWDWLQRDLDKFLVTEINETLGSGKKLSDREAELAFSKIVALIEPIINNASEDDEFGRRLAIQIGGHEVLESVSTLLVVLKHFTFIQSGYLLACELNNSEDVQTFQYALEHSHFPTDASKKLWCTSFVSGVSKIEFLANAIAANHYEKSEAIFRGAGLGEYIDALVIEAQKQIENMERQSGVYRDVDMVCRSISRFHHVARSLHFHLDLQKSTVWVGKLESLTARAANALNGRFSEVVNDVNKVLRPAQGVARTNLDPNEVLQAYNGLYILTATRSARESLALNAAVDRAWREIGQTLEVMVDRIFEHYKLVAGGDPFAAAQVDVAIKFCSIRFGEDYAAVLKRNKQNIEQRAILRKSQA